ncbi:MAG: hypothetical protein JWP00_487 [Chloroflexi bacterium]|nr:hypothetical protein [Chloroflexota bacterium]
MLKENPSVKRRQNLSQTSLNYLIKWRYDLLALLFFGIISFILLWPLSGHLAVSTNNEGDALEQVWVMGWGSHALTTDPANLFNGNIFYPYTNTLAYADHLLAQTLQALPVYLLTGNLILGYGLLTLLSFVLSGWATYLLVKDISGSRAGGVFAGMVFAFASYKIGHLSQLNLLSTQWIPFCFLFLRRMLLQSREGTFRQAIKQGWGTALAFGLFFVLNSLSSFYYFFYLVPALALYLLVFFVYERRWPRPAFIVQLLGVGLLAGLLILPTLLPYAAVVADQGAERTPRDVEQFSANYRFYLGATPNNLLWGNSLSRLAGTGGERALFPGALAYLLGAIGLLGPLVVGAFLKIRRGKVAAGNSPGEHSLRLTHTEKRERWAWVVIGLFALVMSMGWTLHLRGWDVPGLYRLFYNYFPGWVALRAAVRYSVFVLFALAVISGLAVAWLGRVDWAGLRRQIKLGQRTWPLRRIVGLGLVTLLLAGAFLEYRNDITYTNPAVLPNPPEVYRWLADPANAGPVLELPAPPDTANPPSIRSYYSTFHWQPYVNGIAAYIPPVQQDIAALTNEFPSERSLAAFQGMGVRWLVYHLQDENTPLAPAEWQKIEARLGKTPQVKLAKDFPKDKVRLYELAADPWMTKVYAGLPAGAGVIVSDYRRNQPTLVELVQTFLRRDGHSLYGADRAGYRFLTAPPSGHPVSAGLFAADEDPSGYGFSQADLSWSGHGLKFYRRQEKQFAAAYDLDRDPQLERYKVVKGSLELSIEKDRLKFNGNDAGSGKNLEGPGRVNLLLSSFGPQVIKLNGQSIDLPGGTSQWRSPALAAGTKLKIEATPGQTLYLNRAELVSLEASQPGGMTPLPGASLLAARTIQENGRFKSNFQAWTPPVTTQDPGSYVMTLDIYRRPWGTHPGGHFGTFSIALAGLAQTRQVEFDFDPITRKMTARLDGAGADVGAEVFKAAGDGDWAAFITLRSSNPANSQDYPLVGQTRLFEFSLDAGQLTSTKLLPDREMALLPPIPVK